MIRRIKGPLPLKQSNNNGVSESIKSESLGNGKSLEQQQQPRIVESIGGGSSMQGESKSLSTGVASSSGGSLHVGGETMKKIEQ
jgi:lysine-specific histone demethylase 1